jgi:hypothetical protein
MSKITFTTRRPAERRPLSYGLVNDLDRIGAHASARLARRRLREREIAEAEREGAAPIGHEEPVFPR